MDARYSEAAVNTSL